ncbi:hypothetical protein QYE76_012498 [Lolium multiflorum]|uniref:Retrotransposon Copia-like N-terminal domain-containing protein n=1 Tax=Lolium multiflorum TaxID=4521 RepID=A0AAD8TYY8_LOLMU|nr:hypothetical protein QYE76_012498 [Lolium multiflorum]
MSSSNSTATAATLGTPPAQPLTRNNYLPWKALVFPAFRGADVLGLLDGTDCAPPRTLDSEDAEKNNVKVPNPAYGAWLARDQQVLRFLLNSLSKVQHLQDRLNNTKKLSMSADEYFTKMKGFAYELGALGKSLDEDEVISHVLNGLDKGHYNSIITSVNGNPGTSLDELYDQLYAYDLRNGVEESPDSFSSTANVAKRDYRPRGRTPLPRGAGDSGYRGRSPLRAGGDGGYRGRSSPRRYDDDHGNRRYDDDRGNRRYDDDRDTWRRDDRRRDDRRDERRDDRHRDDRRDGDTGATDHITAELSKLSTHDKYQGQDRVRTTEAPLSVGKHAYFNIEHAEENRAENGAPSAIETEESVSDTDENGARHEEEHSSGNSASDPGLIGAPPGGILPPRSPRRRSRLCPPRGQLGLALPGVCGRLVGAPRRPPRRRPKDTVVPTSSASLSPSEDTASVADGSSAAKDTVASDGAANSSDGAANSTPSPPSPPRNQLRQGPPTVEGDFAEWWSLVVRTAPRQLRKGTSSIIMLTAWGIWKHRNDAVFDNVQPSVPSLFNDIRTEARQLEDAGV